MGWFDQNYNPAVGGLLYGAGYPAMSGGQQFGNILQQLGAGALAYGRGDDIGEALRQTQALSEQQQTGRLQRAGMVQELGQSRITNAIQNAQTLQMLNWRNSKLGLPPVTMEQFMGNPQQYMRQLNQPMSVQSPTVPSGPMAARMAGVSTPQQAPMPSPQPVQSRPLSSFQPIAAGPRGLPMPSMPQAPSVSPVAQPPQMAPSQTQTSAFSGALTPEVAQMIQNDALFNKDYADMELKLVQAGLPYQQAQALVQSLGKDKQYMGPNGVTNLPGAVQAGAQVAGANSYATSQGSLPAQAALQAQRGQIERLNDANKASITPYVMTGPDGTGGFTTTNTNNLAASRGYAGLPVLTEMDKAIVPTLVTNVANNATAANAARDSLQQLGELRKALRTLPTGPGTEITNEAAAGLQRAGIDINQFLPQGWQTNPTQYAIAAKNFNNLGMALARANFPGGRITNADLTLALKATPNFGNNPQANDTLLQNIEAIQRLKVDRSEFDNQWLKSHGGVPRIQMEQDWADKVKGMANVPDDIKSSFYSFGDLAASPQAPQTPGMQMPPDAIQAAVNPKTNHTLYLYKGTNGLFWGDENKRPAQ